MEVNNIINSNMSITNANDTLKSSNQYKLNNDKYETQENKINSYKETKSNNYQESNTINKENLDKLITEVNHKFKLANKEFSYDIHEKTNRVTVKIKDSETGKIIKEIPSEESLDLAAKIMEMAGLLIDEKS